MRYITTHDAPATDLRGIGDTTWQRHGACKDLSPTKADRIFFPTARNAAAVAQAKALCARCPVITTCLNAAVDTASREGIWGGQTAAERQKTHADAANRLDAERVDAVVAGRDIKLSGRERRAVAREAVLRGWNAQRLASVLGFTVKHARDMLGTARHRLLEEGILADTLSGMDDPEDLGGTNPDDMTTGAEEFDALQGPTDAELAEQARLAEQAA
ncbi:WhiB family transcriptional regulator [Actinacidiphila sp. DG2A-62]|uniref:WhiB family transcriptional regulator n=1 Tax=Actinacidiphila sp. DG2A-62 TaxID=3108821 RepID=UPI002DBE1C73|nr:WhiB family transcriptional regulator [Actinacidiphila sp. DG2A-62]MEC3997193.1 WhiB family transcriptional regulator [Actinacidiphila sp. DG2A-62]